MIKKEKYKQYGTLGLKPIAITIHNTSSELSAKELFEYLNSKCDTSQGCHYIVDHTDVIQVMPLNYKVWHTGKGNDWAFNYSIAIEICSNVDNDKYIKGQNKAIKLIKKLQKEYGISNDMLFFHQDFNNHTYCPADILNKYGSKQNFIKKEIEREE